MGARLFGVIGGSGLYQMEGLKNVREVEVRTPFGKPSDKLIVGKLGDAELAFLPRHGRGHRWLPSEVNFRANVFAMKKLGVQRIISVSAVGSLRKEIAPALKRGERVLISAHGNSLRALEKHLSKIADSDIVGLEILNTVELEFNTHLAAVVLQLILSREREPRLHTGHDLVEIVAVDLDEFTLLHAWERFFRFADEIAEHADDKRQLL